MTPLLDNFFMGSRIATVPGTSYVAPVGAGRNTYFIRARDAAAEKDLSRAIELSPVLREQVEAGVARVKRLRR